MTPSLALVTGASRGIGLAVAEALRGEGMRVIRVARSLQGRAHDGWVDVRCDLTAAGAAEPALARIVAEHGVPDIVVNNAGIFFVKPLADTTPDDFTATLATNLTAAFLVARALVPRMAARGSGHLVTVGSISDYIGFPGSAAYAASKFGARGMHEVIRAETARTGVRTTLVSPGPVDTAIWDAVDPDTKPGFTKRKDMLRPEDVAEVVLFAVTRPAHVDVTEIRVLPTIYTPRG